MQFKLVSALALATLAAAIIPPPAYNASMLAPPHKLPPPPPPHNGTLPPPPQNGTLLPPPQNGTLPPPPHNGTLPPPHGNYQRSNANPANVNVTPNPTDAYTNSADTKTNPADSKTTSPNKLPPFQGNPLPTIAPGKCPAGHLKCCKIAQLPTDGAVTPVLKSLNVSPDAVSGLVGVTCTTIQATGTGFQSCPDKPLCCTDISFGDKAALACNQVNPKL